MNGSVLALDCEQISDHGEFHHAVLTGMLRRPRSIPSRFLYDARGSALFDKICELPEYYVTRAETEILRRHAGDIAHRTGRGGALIEFGSGSSIKSRILLDALKNPALYSPIDICRQHLDQAAWRLRRDYPGLRIKPICADYMTLRDLSGLDGDEPRLGFFPGSTIGNLEPAEAVTFLCRARDLLGPTGAMVLGVDLKKDQRRLHAAYNDSAGITAAFTLNLLQRINRELQATFDLRAFAHEAFYNPTEGRIEIYFRSLARQSIRVAGRVFEFVEGERVLTEYSYKYDKIGIEAMACAGGFQVAEIWTDPANLFAVTYLVAAKA